MRIFGKRRALAGLLLLASLSLSLAGETNLWPFYVRQEDSPHGRYDHSGSMGPFLSATDRGPVRILSFRPLWTRFDDNQTGRVSDHILYPVLNWTEEGERHHGNALNLIRYRRDSAREETFFQAFPFVFYQNTPRPEDSYFAVWPLGGVLKNRFWRDEIAFALWPLFVRTERGDETRTHVPYPFIQHLAGPHSRGFGLWPIYGHFERDEDYDHTWAAWPFFYNLKNDLAEEVPYHRFGILPFYHRETGAGLRSETWVWPFFGYTRETEPRPDYTEHRYFWPFLVQGRGEEAYKNRWMPAYTREWEPGHEKRWYLWPLLRQDTWEQPGFLRERSSLLYFIYRDEKQHFADTSARLTFLWPLFGYWNNGLGQRQFQAFDPLTVFFPRNEKIRENWSPLFALYRFDERMENRRHSLLWDLLVWEKDPNGLNSIHIGPIFEWVKGSHWEILKGLVGFDREPEDSGMRYFWRH